MADVEQQIAQAVSAFKAGRKEEARSILMSVIEVDERNEKAWLYLSALVDTLEDQQVCLENVLAINPDNVKARKGLDKVLQQISAQQASNPPLPTTDTDAPFASPFDAPIGEFPQPPLPGEASSPFGVPPSEPAWPDSGVGDAGVAGGGDETLDWFAPESPGPFSTPEAHDEDYSPPTSVDWGGSDKPAAYGSGRQVDLPSAQEYDAWVEGLNLGHDESGGPGSAGSPSPVAPFDAGAGDSPFGDTSFMVDTGPFGVDDSPAPVDPVEAPDPSASLSWADTPGSAQASDGMTPAESDVWGVEDDSASSPFTTPIGGESVSLGVETSGGFENSLRSSIAFGDAAPDGAEPPGTLDAGEGASQEPLPDWIAEADAVDAGPEPAVESVETATPAVPSPPVPDKSRYFQYIPAEIEASTGGFQRSTWFLMFGIVLMVVLNVMSYGLLVK